MAYRIIKSGDTTPGSIVEIIADAVEDIETLPTEDIGVGSDCIVIENSSVLIFGNDGKWHVL